MRDLLVVCPQRRDRDAVLAAGLAGRYRVRFAGPDLDSGGRFDLGAFLAECDTIPVDGVVGTKDRAALVAALLARRRGLPGPTPEAIVACQLKPRSRELQAAVAPEATPRFARLGAGPPPHEPPFFVKPVVGRLSQCARRIDRLDELAELPEDAYGERWAELAGLPAAEGRGYLAEELLAGDDEVTFEGYVRGGAVTAIGVTDSVKYPGTGSFERFEYPSRLGAERQAELAAIAARVLPALGFDGGFFNMEFRVPEEGSPGIVEVNGRIASQFAPLVRALHGRSTYDALAALACGDDPAWRAEPPEGVAISFVVRMFEDALVGAVPDPEPGLEILVRPGLRLSGQGVNDAESYRLAIFVETGATREEAVERCRARAASLRFAFA